MPTLHSGYENAVAYAVDAVGGPLKAAAVCRVSRQAVDKWIVKGVLPRTEYTGESSYAALLAAASVGQFTADWLLAEASPKRAAA